MFSYKIVNFSRSTIFILIICSSDIVVIMLFTNLIYLLKFHWTIWERCRFCEQRYYRLLPSTRKRYYLPRVELQTLGKAYFDECKKKHSAKTLFAECCYFAECFLAALGKEAVCRVPDRMHLANYGTLGKLPDSGIKCMTKVCIIIYFFGSFTSKIVV